MSRFTVTDLPLAGLKRVERQRLGDNRGFLARLFCAEELASTGWTNPIAQINHTYSA
jgi:dTDP-4-dehydrorhamnose 3,5-epimerase